MGYLIISYLQGLYNTEWKDDCEWHTGMDMKGSGHGICMKGLRRLTTYLRIVGPQAEIRILYEARVVTTWPQYAGSYCSACDPVFKLRNHQGCHHLQQNSHSDKQHWTVHPSPVPHLRTCKRHPHVVWGSNYSGLSHEAIKGEDQHLGQTELTLMSKQFWPLNYKIRTLSTYLIKWSESAPAILM
jgi:hypothetical protein